MEDLQVDGSTGETEYHENPSFQHEFSLRSQDRTKYICLTEREWRLDSLEDVRYVGLEC